MYKNEDLLWKHHKIKKRKNIVFCHNSIKFHHLLQKKKTKKKKIYDVPPTI